MLSFLTKFEKIVSYLKGARRKLDDKETVTQLLSAMPTAYQSVTSAIDILFIRNSDIATRDFVKIRLLMEESRQHRARKLQIQQTPSVFASHTNENVFRNKSYQYRSNPSSESCNEMSFKFNYYGCGQRGHIKVDCPKNKFIYTKSTVFLPTKMFRFWQQMIQILNLYSMCV